MYENFLEHLNSRVSLTEAEQELIINHLQTKTLRKNQYFLQANDVCKTIAFVEKGALRAYTIDGKGKEHIIQFALEGWTISDLYSFSTGEPATYNIDALEDCEITVISKTAQEEILKKVPAYETYTRMQMTGAYLAMQKRLTSLISEPVEVRYSAFIELYPDIARRVPQHMIASYMGLTPETLSRVRSKMIKQ